MRASERAYEALRRDILNWDLPPGSVLAEVELSERLGVSRTPVREAVAKLVADGLADAQRGRGTVVSDVSLDDLADMFVLRRVLGNRVRTTGSRQRPDRKSSCRWLQKFRDTAEDSQILEDPGPYYQLITAMDELIDDAAGNSYLSGALSKLASPSSTRSPHGQRRSRSSGCLSGGTLQDCRGNREKRPAAGPRRDHQVHLQASLDHILTHAETPKGPHE